MPLRFLGLLLALLLLGPFATAGESAAEILWPADGMAINVKDCGAKGDGVTDDTEALNQALDQGGGKMRVVYIPAGTYLVSRPVDLVRAWTYIQGAGVGRTIIKLKDHSPLYQDKNKALPLIGWSDKNDPTGKAKVSNMAFDIQVNDLTVDSGTGNPGAIGFRYICHNTGGLKNVAIRSGDGTGMVGLDMRYPNPGPSLIKGVSVSGFDYGIWIQHNLYHDTFENIRLEDQRIAGFRNVGHPVSMRKLISRNKVPAVLNEAGGGQIVLLDADLSGGAADTVAIKNVGSMYLRNIKTTGYQAVLEHKGAVTPGAALTEWMSEEWQTLSPSPKKSLHLAIKDTPELPYDPLDQWESVGKHADKVVNDDWGPAIQAAIDAGKRTVYFPANIGKQVKGEGQVIFVRSTVLVRGAVRVIQGCGAQINGEGLEGKPAFRIEKGTPDTVFFEKFTWKGGNKSRPSIEHAARTLVIQQCRWQYVANAAGCGDLFIDCCGGSGWFEVPQKVYLRALNMESGGEAKLVNKAADIWVLGLKTEGDATNIHNLAGGRVEVLGGAIYPAGGKLDRVPAFINEGGAMSVISTGFYPNKIAFKEVMNGQEKTLPDKGRFMNYTCNPREKP